MTAPADFPRRLPRTSRRLRIGVLVGIVLLIVIIYSLHWLATFWTDYLWFQEVGFTSVFRGVLLTKVILAIVFVVLFFLMMGISLTVADRVAPAVPAPGPEDELVDRYRGLSAGRSRLLRILTSVIFALFGGISANKEWNNWDLFRYHQSFHVQDPEFHHDVGFYVFQLPFIEFLLDWFFLAVVVILIVTTVVHYLNGGIRFQSRQQRTTRAVKTHISVLLGILALIKGVDYWFQRLELVLGRSHVVNGATATSVHADLPAKEILIAIAVIAAVAFVANIFRNGWTLSIIGVVLWALVWVILGGIYPAAYQSLRVNPSEYTREKPYIERNITATRTAFGLNNVKVVNDYAGNGEVTADDIQGSSATAAANRQELANVPLLDPNQLQQTFDKYQALRNYYQFSQLNSDRYELNGSLSQVVTSVRELNSSQVPSGFTNTHLEYTHGYGAVVAPASQDGVLQNGTPSFSLSQIPPVGQPSLTQQPGSEIYYGEDPSDSSFVVADSKQQELDYERPNGSEAGNKYNGAGGVAAGNIFRRAALALRFGNLSLLLSGQVTSKSKVMYNRNILQRAQKAAPFLKFDADPYAVILNGQTYWVQDAYTTTDNYPYAQQANTGRVPAGSGLSGKFNYVRNTVKVVTNAYTGKMDFFVVDNSDPIIKVYEKAFPDLFTPATQADKLIPGITAHFRYAQDLFRVQTNMYGRYHLTNPSDFYSQSQAWSISQDPGSGPLSQTQLTKTIQGPNGQLVVPPTPRLQPEYILARNQSSTTAPNQLTFEALQPFEPYSPSGKQQNLTAFMTAASDPNDYGQLTVYETPPAQNVDGPALITNAIKSNSQIAQLLTLLNQNSSQVVLGQVQAIPIDDNLLYVEPIYVQSSSTTGGVPLLRDVVVVYNNTAYDSGNASLDAALCKITNADNSTPFSSYCNTGQANKLTPGSSGSGDNGSGSSGGSGTGGSGTGSSTTTTTPPASGNQSVQSLLQQAQSDFTQAQTYLKQGNLAQYQNLINEASTLVNQAAAASGGSTPPSSTTTTPPASSTTSTTKPKT